MPDVTTFKDLLDENDRLRRRVTELEARERQLLENNSKCVMERRSDDVWMHAYEFHQALNIPAFIGPPRVPSVEHIRTRLLLSAEEFYEQLKACFHVNPALRDALFDEVRYARIVRVDFVELADSWCDMNFVNNGSACQFGVQIAPLAREVFRSNMTKKGAPRNAVGKILKGPHFEPPQIERLLREQGWNGSNLPEA